MTHSFPPRRSSDLNGDLVPAEPCGKRALGVHAAFAFGVDHDAQARSDNAQKLVADMMAQRVVDRFEPVQVDEDQRGARAVVRGGLQLQIGRASCRERVWQYV